MKHISTKLLIITLFFFFIGVSTISYSQIFYDEGFENGTPTYENISCYNQSERFTIQSTITRSGNYAAHFESLPDEGTRCEMIPVGSSQQYHWGQEYWLGFSYYLPYFLDNELGWRIINQHHSIPGPIGNPDWSFKAGGNGFTILIRDGKFRIRITRPDVLNHYIDGTTENPLPGSAASGTNVHHEWSLEINEWFDIVANFKYSDNESDGFFKVWVNGILQVDITGTNVMLHDTAGRLKERRNYQKIGIYTGVEGGGAIIYDDLRIGGSASSYEDVAPGEVLSISDEIFNNNISTTPNPTINIFTIDLKKETLKKAIIYNQLGQQVKEVTTNEVNISNLTEGIYFVKITSESGKTATKKIIKN